MDAPEILIVGAGPTGLTLAVWLALSGTKFRIVDPKPGPTHETRAVGVQARTLEMWDRMGLSERAIPLGRKAEGIDFWVDGKVKARIPLGDMGQGLSAHPYVFMLGQDQTERLLVERLGECGISVEWRTEFVSLEQKGERVDVQLGGKADEGASFRFVCGCDGARSLVRQALGLSFPGGTYAHHFFVADVIATGQLIAGELNGALFANRFMMFFPLGEKDRYRLVGTLPADLDPRTVTMDDIQPEAERLMKAEINDVRWFSVYHVHHRVTERFQVGNVFVAGDAGHVHSPVGAQGMNTGIQDAINLAWKLNDVMQRSASPKLLATYPEERMPFAQSLIKSTDRAFQTIVAKSASARFFRLRVFPKLLRFLVRFKKLQRFMFRTVSQTKITYQRSSIAEGKVGKVRGGDRLPWVPGLYEEQAVGEWRLYAFGAGSTDARGWAESRKMGYSERSVSNEMRSLGYRECFCLMRPDGYVGTISARWDRAGMDRYLRETVGWASL